MATKKGGGAKTTRSETVTVRLDPELRYLAEIAARVQRRTLSSFIEWAILDSLSRVKIDESTDQSTTVADVARKLWDVDEADRFVKLAIIAPHLLNYDEQKLWKLIKENGAVWKGYYDHDDNWAWHVEIDRLDTKALRGHWEVFVEVAAGVLPEDMLPKWNRRNPDPIPF